ncbi:CYFA0S25e00782g1_1 [Cyberlindnera fabianii]|uniref:Protein BZZ1 n=1 Tax=Cyberlindnera fabianii TaxID=36022 RepID=A0A061B9Q4_CYBFA|nr:CYFA0S25e00782g1_1 [Cyberlindnera fabianii]
MDVSIGNELKDAFKETDNWVGNNLVFLSDVEQFYRQRSQIEKEYASKLQALSSEYLKKKATRTTNVSVGDNPKFTPGSLESATLVAWTEILSQTETIAKNHQNFSNELSIKSADQVLALQRTCEALKLRIENIHQETLLKKKDEVFDQVTRAKKEYDETCSSMESTRSKAEKSGNKEKYQRKLVEKETDMNVAKNNYLIKISIANRIKDKFYYQDLPEVLDILQDVSEFKTKHLNRLWKNAATLEMNKNTRDTKCLERMTTVINENLPHLDTAMFIKHNQSQWSEPQDFYYIPSSIWHDDETFVTKPAELSALKKTLMIAHKTVDKYEEALESERERLNSLQQKRQEYKAKPDEEFEFKASIDSLQGYLNTLGHFVVDETLKVSAQVEIETIENNAGEQDLSLDNLQITTKKRGFLSRLKGGSSKKDVVQDLSASGNGSGGADVFGDGESIKSGKSHHSSSHFRIGSLMRHRGTSISSSATAATSATTSLQGTALYAYQAGGDDEVSISANESFAVVAADDGSGWTEIHKDDGSQGLVPTSYIQVSTVEKKREPPAVTPRKGARKISYCVAKYDYTATEDNELTIRAGDRIEVVKGDDGGWTEGELNGATGLFPTAYVEFE